jgi:hypothetical protein
MTVHELSQLVLDWIWARPKPLHFQAKHVEQAQPVILRLLTNKNLKLNPDMCKEVAEEEARKEYSDFYGVEVKVESGGVV